MRLRGEIDGRPFVIESPAVEDAAAEIVVATLTRSGEILRPQHLAIANAVTEPVEPARDARQGVASLTDLIALYKPTRFWMRILLTAYHRSTRGRKYSTARELRNEWSAASSIRIPNFARDARLAMKEGYGYLTSRSRHGVSEFAITRAGVDAVETGAAFVARRIVRARNRRSRR